MAKITLTTIAQKAGVAKSTASYALNDAYTKGINISEETRNRIKATAAECGYVIDDMARAISTGKTKILGFACALDTRLELSVPILTSVMAAARDQDFLVKMLFVEPDGEDRFAEICFRQRLSAVVIYRLGREAVQDVSCKLARKGIVPAIVGNSFTPPGVIHVRCDDKKGCSLMVRKLYELGHRKIAYISSAPEYLASSIRREGYEEESARLGLEPAKSYAWGSKNPEALQRHVLKLLRSDRPDAIFCSGDNVAAVIIVALTRLGLRVPEDISVAGFGNQDVGQFFLPQISTVDERHEKTGLRVVEKTMAQLNRQEHGDLVELLAPALILRQSTAPRNSLL